MRVIACPRSGTRYAAHVLKRAGLAIGHESDAKHGTVSCFMAVDDFWYAGHRGPRLSEAGYTVTLHQVREPLASIAAMMRLNKLAFWHWTASHTGIAFDDPESPEPYARFWLAWNAICERQAQLTYRLEAMDEAWPDIARLIDADVDFPAGVPHVGETKAPNPRRVTMDEIKAADAMLAEEIRTAARRYGYEEIT